MRDHRLQPHWSLNFYLRNFCLEGTEENIGFSRIGVSIKLTLHAAEADGLSSMLSQVFFCPPKGRGTRSYLCSALPTPLLIGSIFQSFQPLGHFSKATQVLVTVIEARVSLYCTSVQPIPGQ